MGDDEQISLRFECQGIQLELSGRREFVEPMYQQLMDDIQQARRTVRDRNQQVDIPEPEPGKKPSAWVHRCGELMHKIYMLSKIDLQSTPIADLFDLRELSNIYAEQELFTEVFDGLDGRDTLWAEFTPVGRRKIKEIEEITRPLRDSMPVKK